MNSDTEMHGLRTRVNNNASIVHPLCYSIDKDQYFNALKATALRGWEEHFFRKGSRNATSPISQGLS
jgi:hypothetical protein